MKNLFFKISGIILIAYLFINSAIAQKEEPFLLPPELINISSSTENYLPEHRTSSGISSLAVSRNGRLWAVWYAGITPGIKVEDCVNNYIVVATSGDKGETWKEVLVIDPDGPGPVRAFDPEVWIDPEGQLWIFWAQHIKPVRSTTSGVWAISSLYPDEKDPEWSEPRRLIDGVMMCKPIVLSDGVWALPVSFWHLLEESAKIVISSDRGQTWKVRGAVNVPKNVRNHDEHMIVERKDESLWMLVRTNYGIGESISKDRGKTWSPLIPSKIQHTASRFFICRLHSGNLLFVKHGPIDMRIGRSHLMAFISKDDGHSWSNGLLLDERIPVTYPDGQQATDGTIYITYDYHRSKDQHVLMTSFSEADVISGSEVSIYETYLRRRVISNAGNR